MRIRLFYGFRFSNAKSPAEPGKEFKRVSSNFINKKKWFSEKYIEPVPGSHLIANVPFSIIIKS